MEYMFRYVSFAFCHGDVVRLTDRTFDSQVMQTESGIWFVRFFAPWCGHCKRMAPSWESMSTQLKGIMAVADVDATAELQLSTRFHIDYYPTVLLFTNDTIYEYDGPRGTQHLVQFAKEAKESIAVGQTPRHCSIHMKRNRNGVFIYKKQPEDAFVYRYWLQLGGVAIVIGLTLLCITCLLTTESSTAAVEERPLLPVV